MFDFSSVRGIVTEEPNWRGQMSCSIFVSEYGHPKGTQKLQGGFFFGPFSDASTAEKFLEQLGFLPSRPESVLVHYWRKRDPCWPHHKPGVRLKALIVEQESPRKLEKLLQDEWGGYGNLHVYGTHEFE